MQIDLEAQITELKATIAAQSEHISKQGARTAYLEGELQIAEAVSTRYQIDAVGYKAERDKLRDALEFLVDNNRRYESGDPDILPTDAGEKESWIQAQATLGAGGRR